MLYHCHRSVEIAVFHVCTYSLQESSPRSDAEASQDESTFYDYHKQVKLAIDNVKEMNRSKSTLMKGTFDISKSRINKSADDKSLDDVKSSNDSGCSVNLSSEVTDPEDQQKLKCTQLDKYNSCAKGKVKKKDSPPRFTMTQSLSTKKTTDPSSRTGSSSRRTESRNGAKGVTVVGRTLVQSDRSTSQETSIQKKNIRK